LTIVLVKDIVEQDRLEKREGRLPRQRDLDPSPRNPAARPTKRPDLVGDIGTIRIAIEEGAVGGLERVQEACQQVAQKLLPAVGMV
jgi:hypothetical protein